MAIFFTFLAAVFFLMHGYVEDVGMAPANKLVEVIVLAVLAVLFGALAFHESRAAPPEDHERPSD